MILTPARLHDLAQAICETFTQDELTQVLRATLGEDLAAISPSGSFFEVVSALIHWHQQQDTTSLLVRILCRERPRSKICYFCEQEETPPPMAASHQLAALPLHMTIVVIFGVLALACIGGGIYAIVTDAQSRTEFAFLGAALNTGHVGVAFVGIGLIIAFFTIRGVLKNQHELAALPLDEHATSRKKAQPSGKTGRKK